MGDNIISAFLKINPDKSNQVRDFFKQYNDISLFIEQFAKDHSSTKPQLLKQVDPLLENKKFKKEQGKLREIIGRLRENRLNKSDVDKINSVLKQVSPSVSLRQIKDNRLYSPTHGWAEYEPTDIHAHIDEGFSFTNEEGQTFRGLKGRREFEKYYKNKNISTTTEIIDGKEFKKFTYPRNTPTASTNHLTIRFEKSGKFEGQALVKEDRILLPAFKYEKVLPLIYLELRNNLNKLMLTKFCGCGCGELVFNRRSKYVNKTHRERQKQRNKRAKKAAKALG